MSDAYNVGFKDGASAGYKLAIEDMKLDKKPQINEKYEGDYATLLARVARLEEALREICDYDSYKHPDESFIALRDAAIKESTECTACQHAKTSKWPPSGLCNEHYRTVTRAEDKVKQMFEYKQTWEPREIARRALEEK